MSCLEKLKYEVFVLDKYLYSMIGNLENQMLICSLKKQKNP